MHHVPSVKRWGLALLCVGGSFIAMAASASAAGGPPSPVSGSLIGRVSGTLRPGTRVPGRALGRRVFPDASHGFALASVGQAQYAAGTANGGRTWRIISPALHLNAAQAPLAVLSVGASSRRTVFAFGGGQAVDVTRDGGRHWYRALFNGLTMAVVPNPRGHLVAFIDGSSTGGAHGPTWQYVSKNGGRTWRYDTTVGGS